MKHVVRAFIHHYDDKGRRTKPAERTFAMLCIGAEPQVLNIQLRDRRTTRFRSVQISRAELERVLRDNPKPKRKSKRKPLPPSQEQAS